MIAVVAEEARPESRSRCCSSTCKAGAELQLEHVPETALEGEEHHSRAVHSAVSPETRGNRLQGQTGRGRNCRLC